MLDLSDGQYAQALPALLAFLRARPATRWGPAVLYRRYSKSPNRAAHRRPLQLDSKSSLPTKQEHLTAIAKRLALGCLLATSSPIA